MKPTSRRPAPNDPNTARSWLREATLALGAGEYERAHRACMRVLRSAQGDAGHVHAEALLVLAQIAAAHGNAAKADDITERALGIAGVDAELRARLLAFSAQARSAQRQHTSALERARLGAALEPSDPHACDTLGVVFARAGEHEQALPLFARAAQRAPTQPSYRYNLATALQFTGDLAAAERAYRETLALDPTRHAARAALAQLCAADDDEVAADVAQALAAAEQANDADACLLLGHAQATLQERRGNARAAMHALLRAKSRKRAAIAHEPAQDAALFGAAVAACYSGFSECSDIADAAPLFVFGLPRSGTTLVERILASHPEVRAAGELGDLSAAAKSIAGTSTPAVLDVETLCAATHASSERLGRAYLERTRRQRSSPDGAHAFAHFVDKMPLNFFYAAAIHRALPNARMVCLHRQPMDACLGNYRQLFSTRFSYYNYAYDLEHTAHYVVQFERYLAVLRDCLPADRLMIFDYDALVREQETMSRRLLAFCGLDWDPACLQFERNAAAVATASSVQVRQPLYGAASGRWRSYGELLAPAQRIFELAGIAIA